jgi:O-methyltransferase
MVGRICLNGIQELLVTAFMNSIPGDYVEFGVWRGGASVFARGVMRAYGQGHRRSFVCDSFGGLPNSTYQQDGKTIWSDSKYLEVSDDEVAANFDEYSLLDRNVLFVKGFFSNALVPFGKMAAAQNLTFCILRCDGDMYESTVDILYNLYDKLSVGSM